MNLFPDTVQGVSGPTISTAILKKTLFITGRLIKGALSEVKTPFLDMGKRRSFDRIA